MADRPTFAPTPITNLESTASSSSSAASSSATAGATALLGPLLLDAQQLSAVSTPPPPPPPTFSPMASSTPSVVVVGTRADLNNHIVTNNGKGNSSNSVVLKPAGIGLPNGTSPSSSPQVVVSNTNPIVARQNNIIPISSSAISSHQLVITSTPSQGAPLTTSTATLGLKPTVNVLNAINFKNQPQTFLLATSKDGGASFTMAGSAVNSTATMQHSLTTQNHTSQLIVSTASPATVIAANKSIQSVSGTPRPLLTQVVSNPTNLLSAQQSVVLTGMPSRPGAHMNLQGANLANMRNLAPRNLLLGSPQNIRIAPQGMVGRPVNPMFGPVS